MAREYTDEEITNMIMHFIDCLHKEEMQMIRKMCSPNVMWKFGSSYSDGSYSTLSVDMLSQRIKYRDIAGFANIGIQIRRFTTDNIVVTGTYRVDSKAGYEPKHNYFDYTIVLSEGLAVFVQHNERNDCAKIHRVVAVNEAVYNLEETALLYIESLKDHVIWHCDGGDIESIDTLKRLEGVLSGDFIRVHRSYIVNNKRVFSIQRCSVTMTNGDNIPIPYKKYVEVKKKMLCK